jgi:ketosteroid isomerase-like protein
MSQENVEAVRRFMDALVREDWKAVLAELDPEVEIDDLDISLDTDHYRGHEGFVKWLSVWNDAWDSWRLEDVEVLPVGEDRVIALFLMLVTGKGSRIELDRRDALTCTMRAGKIVGMAYYNDQQQAREAVGLGTEPVESP